MLYQIHLYAPKTGRLTPAMIDWLIQHGQDASQPEAHIPVRRLRPLHLAGWLRQLDPSLIAVPGALAQAGQGEDVELHYPLEQIGLRLYIHQRGVIVLFPFSAGTLARIVLGIAYTYIRFLYDQAGFWSFDPQLNVLSYADDFQNIDETAALMEALLPKLLE
jgi:hypothetical protein